jgi:hypothetical protein
VYDIDIDKVGNINSPDANPPGFYASVKRWAGTETVQIANLTDYYDVFYPASNHAFRAPNDSRAPWPSTTDQFAPLWVTFERRARKAVLEGTPIDRFKVAKQMPFHMIWWPDPAARSLACERALEQPPDALLPNAAYYHMAGRTSFMFTVPMFPSS